MMEMNQIKGELICPDQEITRAQFLYGWNEEGMDKGANPKVPLMRDRKVIDLFKNVLKE